METYGSRPMAFPLLAKNLSTLCESALSLRSGTEYLAVTIGPKEAFSVAIAPCSEAREPAKRHVTRADSLPGRAPIVVTWTNAALPPVFTSLAGVKNYVQCRRRFEAAHAELKELLLGTPDEREGTEIDEAATDALRIR